MLNLIKKIMNNVTLSRVFMWVLALTSCVLFYTLYENRIRVFELVSEKAITNPVGLTFSAGEITREVITRLVNSDKTIVAIGIMAVDLRLNEAKTIFVFSNNETLKRIGAESRQSGTFRVPLFTNIDDSNADVIRLINGQFTCSKFESTLRSRIYPDLKLSIKMICRSSIPSYYGYFSGFIEVYLKDVASPEQQQQLKLMADKLATDVYFRDVIPTQKSERVDGKVPFSPK